MNFRLLCILAGAALMAACDSPSPEVAETTSVPQEQAMVLPEIVSFNEHIQPVLSEYCYHCHGPDAGTRKPDEAPLRLDIKEEAFAVRDDGKPVIIKGDPENSKLAHRIHSDDVDLIMPPPESHKTLSAREVALLERWIEQGAEYEEHWAFMPVERANPPAVQEDWATNPIDRFIAAKMQEQGLEPNPPEDPRRFHRRLSLDTTGLPPEPAETDAFVAAHEEDPKAAVEQEAMRLLETTASAEHFARHWLDAARYADTHGIHIDNYRAIWPYRDWVVRCFKQNMPWDQFTTEQMAGDMLPDRTLDQWVASGFNRCLATTGEGGAIAEEYEAVYAKDRVETVSAIWLGLTTGCAACHDHKFDPISTKEFYSLTAFFRNTTMTALDRNNAEHPPNVFVPHVDDRGDWKLFEEKLKKPEEQIAKRKQEARPAYEKWVANAEMAPRAEVDRTLALYLPLTEEDGPLRGFVNGEPREWAAKVKRVDGVIGKAPIIKEPVVLGDLGNFDSEDQVSFGAFIRVEGKPTGTIISRMDPAQDYKGWSLELKDGKPLVRIVHVDGKNENHVLANKALAPGKWHHFMCKHDGTKASHQSTRFVLNGKNYPSKTYPNTGGGNIDAKVPLRLGALHDNSHQLNGQVAIQDFRLYHRNPTYPEMRELARLPEVAGIFKIASDKRTEKQEGLLYEYYLTNVDEPSLELRTQIEAIKAGMDPIKARGSVSLVMDEKDEMPYAHVLGRGVYSNKGEKVYADTPAVLPAMPEDVPKNRLGLAQWLNDPANPLPARVTMNRTWYYFFGRGIVETNADFGIMGARPSHPKLLDWLASEFIESEWDYRHMVHLMVTSSAYRQSGKISPEKLHADPDNILITRGPRHRLDAEQIRDLALAASDLLSDKVGGAPAKPYQPKGVWQAVAMPQSNTKIYRPETGENLYRRSIYTIWKRTAPPPSMEIFNAPTREVFCVQRERTNTPLQALVLLNDPQFVEASRELAANAMRNEKSFDGRLDYITRNLLSRTFSDDERSIVKASFEATYYDFKRVPDNAHKYLSEGAKPAPEDLEAPELAAWSLLASQVMNLDETITR